MTGLVTFSKWWSFMLSLTWVVTERNHFAVTASLEADLAVMQGDDKKPTHPKIFSPSDMAHLSGCTITIIKAKKETATHSQAGKTVVHKPCQ